MTTKRLRRHTCQSQKVSKLGLGWIYTVLHPSQSLDFALSSWNLIPSLCVFPSLSVSSIPALTVPHLLQSTRLLNTHTTCAHTHSPTDFQNNTRMFTKPENPERNHISKGVWSSHTDVAVFFLKFSFHIRDFPLALSPTLLGTVWHSFSFPQPSPIPPSHSPWSQGESFIRQRSLFWKSCWDSLRRRERKRCATWKTDVSLAC